MTTQFTWTISQLNCIPQVEENLNVITTVHWRCEGVDDIYSGTVYGSCGLSPSEGDFTPYADITIEQVLSWVWSAGVNKDENEAAVSTQIACKINPPSVSPILPWE